MNATDLIKNIPESEKTPLVITLGWIGDGPPEPSEITSNQLKTPPENKLKPIIFTPKWYV